MATDKIKVYIIFFFSRQAAFESQCLTNESDCLFSKNYLRRMLNWIFNKDESIFIFQMGNFSLFNMKTTKNFP